MPKLPFSSISLGAAILLGSCTQQGPTAASDAGAPAGKSQCFFAPNVNGFGAATDSSVLIQVGANSYYRLDLIGPCHDISWATGLAFRTTTGGSNWVCDGADAEIIVPGQVGGRCMVTGVHPITKAEWRAAPAR